MNGERVVVGNKTVDELKALFVGKDVITRRELTYDEYVNRAGPLGWTVSWVPGFELGVHGTIIDFVFHDGKILARDEEGWEWWIEPETTIEVID